MPIRIGIYGYGNLGRGVELAIAQNPDMKLVAVFTRRDPKSLRIQTPDAAVCAAEDAARYTDAIDVMILCGGSATDLPVQTPAMARLFSVVDSFDTHAKIPAHFASVDAAAREGGHTAMISVGWDPGLFSLSRMLGAAILPDSTGETFWGKGVSQGHSDAIRRIEGVLDAKQYTIPVQAAMEAARGGEGRVLSAREKHKRECFVVAADGADLARIEREITQMPNYFADYDTTVHFISAEELRRDHGGMQHGGFVIRSGRTGENGAHRQLIEYSLQLDSNPEFTASVLVAYARATYRLDREGAYGCKTVFDVPPAYLSPMTRDELLATLL